MQTVERIPWIHEVHWIQVEPVTLFLQLELLQRFALHAFLPGVEAKLQAFGLLLLHHSHHGQLPRGFPGRLTESGKSWVT